MQHDANLLHDWLCRNVLFINTEKTCYVTFGRAKYMPNLKTIIDGTEIQLVKTYKYLGLVLDEDLKFDAHINM